jgi:hypothetical protein
MQALQEKFILVELSVIFLLLGCTDVQVKEERKIVTDIGVNEKVSFILDRSIIKDVDDAEEIEVKIENCIEKELKKLESPIQTVSAETFRKTVFPDMDYLSVPSSPDSILALLNSPDFQQRIKPLGLRYLLVLHGESAGSTSGDCGGSQALICFFITYKKTIMSAFVMDLAKSRNAGEVKTEAVGKGWFAILGIFPIGYPAISEGPACKALGQKVATFIVGNRQKQIQ